MRILHVIDSAGMYGAEAVLLELMKYQKKLELQPALLSLGDTGISQKSIESAALKSGLEVHTLRFRNGLNIFGALNIIRKAREIGADIIHSHGYKSNILLGMLPKVVRGIPVIATMHGWTNIRPFSKLWIYKLADILCLKNIESAVCVSSSIVKNRTLKRLGINPVIIPNGIAEIEFDENKFSNAFPNVAGKCKDTFALVSIGRLSLEKGHEILIKALGEIKKRNIRVQLVIFGEGPQRKLLENAIKREHVEDNVALLGYSSDAKSFLRNFNVFILPSFTEGLPITLLEALQAELPVIATKVGEISEVLQHGRYGTLISPGDWRELVRAIEALHSSYPEALERASEAKKMALKHYTVEAMTDKYLYEYKRVLTDTGKFNSRGRLL